MATVAARRASSVTSQNTSVSNQPYIGRRTGKVINIIARKNSHGFENISDYFPDSESEDDVFGNSTKTGQAEVESSDDKPTSSGVSVSCSSETISSPEVNCELQTLNKKIAQKQGCFTDHQEKENNNTKEEKPWSTTFTRLSSAETRNINQRNENQLLTESKEKQAAENTYKNGETLSASHKSAMTESTADKPTSSGVNVSSSIIACTLSSDADGEMQKIHRRSGFNLISSRTCTDHTEVETDCLMLREQVSVQEDDEEEASGKSEDDYMIVEKPKLKIQTKRLPCKRRNINKTNKSPPPSDTKETTAKGSHQSGDAPWRMKTVSVSPSLESTSSPEADGDRQLENTKKRLSFALTPQRCDPEKKTDSLVFQELLSDRDGEEEKENEGDNNNKNNSKNVSRPRRRKRNVSKRKGGQTAIESEQELVPGNTDGSDDTLKVKKKRGRKTALESSSGGVVENVQGVKDDVPEGPRRSQRHRVPPLQYWKNERIQYERRKSGWVVSDVITNPTPEENIRKRKVNKKAAKRVRKNESKSNDHLDEQPELSEVNVPEGLAEESDPVCQVINPDTMKKVKMKLLHTSRMLHFQSPVEARGEDNDSSSPLLLDKYFSHGDFGAGQVLLRAGAEKGTQHVRRDTMVFHILSGRVLVCIHDQSFVLGTGSSFFVPQGNVYNLKNLETKKDACLFFTQIKG